jgi:hypothetical protein
LGAGDRIEPEHRADLAVRVEDAMTEGVPRWLTQDPRARSESFDHLRGPGGFPVVVSSIKGGHEATNPADLLATLPSKDAPVPAAERTASVLPSEQGDDSRPDLSAVQITHRPDYLTTAFSLALGVSLTTGPLYPDLMALLRTCLPGRASRPSQPQAARNPSGHSRRGLARWLRLLRRS